MERKRNRERERNNIFLFLTHTHNRSPKKTPLIKSLDLITRRFRKSVNFRNVLEKIGKRKTTNSLVVGRTSRPFVLFCDILRPGSSFVEYSKTHTHPGNLMNKKKKVGSKTH